MKRRIRDGPKLNGRGPRGSKSGPAPSAATPAEAPLAAIAMLPPSFILPAMVAAGLVLGWLLARWLERRHDRGTPASSEDLLDELESASSPRRHLELCIDRDALPALLDCLAGQIDSGFGPRQCRQLTRRIHAHQHRGIRSALFLIRVNGVRCDLDFHWTRDPDQRIRLRVLAVPKLLRALKRHLGAAAAPAARRPAPERPQVANSSQPAGDF